MTLGVNYERLNVLITLSREIIKKMWSRASKLNNQVGAPASACGGRGNPKRGATHALDQQYCECFVGPAQAEKSNDRPRQEFAVSAYDQASMT